MKRIKSHKILKTSLYVRKHRLIRLQNAAKTLHISMTDLLSVLIYKSRRLVNNTPQILETVQYQQQLGKKAYKTKKVSLYCVDHEYLAGTRNIFKISASFLLAVAIDRFLDDILEKGIDHNQQSSDKRKRHNYAIIKRNYVISYSRNELKEFWTLHWDLQKE